MANNKNGFDYENTVIKCLKQTNINGMIVEAAGASSWGADADFMINDKIYNLEIKLNSNAQMGGTSIKLEEDTFTICNKVDDELEKLINQSMEKNLTDLKALLLFVSMLENKNHNNFPMTCKKDSWETAQKMNMLINDKIPFNTDFICDHYSKKNTHYIQIGGAGLFYLKDNPANLPIPKLNGQINIEIRTGRSGSKKSPNGDKIVTAGIRIQGRLKTNCKSPYTLDNIDSIKQLINFSSTQ